MARGPERVCLLNDSFPPLIDGVANAVVNYATIIQHGLGRALVGTPYYPDAVDDYDFPVVRYRSVNTTKLVGYRAGYPFSARSIGEIEKFRPDIIHSHCPIVSNMMARTLREKLDVPVVFTYHTKFDIDIANAINGKLLQAAAIRALVDNIEACDEVWVVSHGAGENLRSLGYQGDYVVMENGVDFPRGAAEPDRVAALAKELAIPPDTPVYLFVGRMMWYKGIRIILEALAQLKKAGRSFRMLLVGDGADRQEMEKLAGTLDIADACTFTGAVRDRELLRAYFSLADLFLFPSTFDTNGIVVREAAACGTASVLIRNSCAAEGIGDGDTGYLIAEDAESMAKLLSSLSREQMGRTGRQALEKLYVSWEDSVHRAYRQYGVVLENYQRGLSDRHFDWTDDIFSLMSDLCQGVERARGMWEKVRRRR